MITKKIILLLLWAALSLFSSIDHAIAESGVSKQGQLVRSTVKSKTDCSKILHDLYTEIHGQDGNGPVIEFDPIKDQEILGNKTIRVIRSAKGKHGGRITLLEKIGRTWMSGYLETGHDPQGDPHWWVYAIGEDAASFFGFKIVDDHHIWIPNFKEFNGALTKINAYLEKHFGIKTGIGFREGPKDDKTKVKEYVRNFIRYRQIPISRGGNHHIHDIAFHSGAALFPEKYAVITAGFMEFQDEFFLRLRKKFSKDETKLAGIKYLDHVFKVIYTFDIDVQTAYVNVGIVRYLMKRHKNAQKAINGKPVDPINLKKYFTQAMKFTNYPKTDDGQITFLDVLKYQIQVLQSEAIPGNPQYNLKYYNDIKLRYAVEFLKGVDFNQELEEFSKNYQSKFYPNFNAYTLLPSEAERTEEFCVGVAEQRVRIRQATLALLEEMKKSP